MQTFNFALSKLSLSYLVVSPGISDKIRTLSMAIDVRRLTTMPNKIGKENRKKTNKLRILLQSNNLLIVLLQSNCVN